MWAVVPIKFLADAKQRLADLLAPAQRRELCAAMASDVLARLSACSALEGVLVVSPDPDVKALAERFACDYLPETELGVQGFNAGMNATVARLAEAGVSGVMIIHGDLPLLSDEDLATMLDTHAGLDAPAVTIATDRHGLGSNCVLCSPATGFEFQFGENSLRKHVSQARDKEMAVRVLRLPGTALDIDTADDFEKLLAVPRADWPEHTGRCLNSLGLFDQSDDCVDSTARTAPI